MAKSRAMPRKSGAKSKREAGNGATLGFEQKLWQAADEIAEAAT